MGWVIGIAGQLIPIPSECYDLPLTVITIVPVFHKCAIGRCQVTRHIACYLFTQSFIGFLVFRRKLIPIVWGGAVSIIRFMGMPRSQYDRCAPSRLGYMIAIVAEGPSCADGHRIYTVRKLYNVIVEDLRSIAFKRNIFQCNTYQLSWNIRPFSRGGNRISIPLFLHTSWNSLSNIGPIIVLSFLSMI